MMNTNHPQTSNNVQQEMQKHQMIATEAMLASFILPSDETEDTSESDSKSFVLGYN